jgi:hypothetical protein
MRAHEPGVDGMEIESPLITIAIGCWEAFAGETAVRLE